MSETQLGPIPFQTAFLTKSGHLTSAWQKWLLQLFERVGGNLAPTNNDTLLNPMSSLGDMIYGGTDGDVNVFSGNKSTAKAFLTQAGTGSASAIPVWQEGLESSDIPDNASNTSGSAGSLSQVLAQYAVILGAGTGVTAVVSLGVAGQVLTSNGPSVAPSYQNGNGALVVYGTRASPIPISASAGITTYANQRQLIRIAGNGSAVTITASPPLSAGSIDGQELILEGSDTGDTVTINTGAGVEMSGQITLGTGDKIAFLWNTGASLWTECWRFSAGLTGDILTDDSGNPLTDDSGNPLSQ